MSDSVDHAVIHSSPRSARLRLLGFMLWIVTLAGTTSASAQTYDPRHPVCLQTYATRGGGYIDCSFGSLEQCRQTASGRAAQCYLNPYFASEQSRPVHGRRVRPPYR
jgi:hypothetical protein